MEESIKLMKNKKAQVFAIKVNLHAVITPEEGGGYSSYCPALDLFSEGETRKEAKDNLIDLVRMMIEDHLESGTFLKWMKKRGFVSPAKIARASARRKTEKAAPRGVRVVNIPAEFPIAAYC